MDAIVFVPLLAFTWLIGFVALSSAGHYFLTIVEESATPTARRSFEGGRDLVGWSVEGIIDWYWKGFYLVYMVACALSPAFLIGSLLSENPFLKTTLIGFLFALFFPFAVLSSLATSRWNPFWPRLFWSFGQRPSQTLTFYLFSIPLMMAMLHLLNLMLFRSDVLPARWAIVLVPLVILGFFVYSRLLGRLGMVISFTRTDSESEEEAEAEHERPRNRKLQRRKQHPDNWGGPTAEHTEQPINAQPATLPPLMTPYDGEITGYGVDFGNKPVPAGTSTPKPERIIHHFDDDDEAPLVVAPPDHVESQRKANLAEPPPHLMKLYDRARIKEPDHPFGTEVFSFLYDPKTIEPFLRLSALVAVLVFLQRALTMLRPI